MKKYMCCLAMMVTLIGFSSEAYANEDIIDVREVVVEQNSAGTQMFKGMHKTKHAKGKHKHKNKQAKHKEMKHYKQKFVPVYASQIMQCRIEDINENYQDVLRKIASSSISQNARRVLSYQAQENYDLAVKQLKERMALRAKQACERVPYQCELITDKKNRKILRDIDAIL